MATGTNQPSLSDAAKAASLKPLWEHFDGGLASEPVPPPPHIWRWDELRPLTERAANEVPMEQVERRVLTLKDPNDEAGRLGTSINLVGALQTLLPGENARTHRHSGNALRFVLEGDGAETIVDGKSCPMSERDLILTPVWSWHGHVHGGAERIVWFDALDIPMWRHMNAAFYEEGPPKNMPPQTPDAAYAAGGFTPEIDDEIDRPSYSPMFRYPWESAVETLSRMPEAADGSRTLRYTNPQTGGSAMTLIDCFLTQLAGGRATQPRRATWNAICVVAEGEGTSTVGDSEIAWRRNDIFTLPGWNWVSHRGASEDAKLFFVTDRDAIDRLGMLREERRD